MQRQEEISFLNCKQNSVISDRKKWKNNPDKRDLNPTLKLELDGIFIFLFRLSLPLTRYGRHYLQVSWEGEAECKFGLIAGGRENGLPGNVCRFPKSHFIS